MDYSYQHNIFVSLFLATSLAAGPCITNARIMHIATMVMLEILESTWLYAVYGWKAIRVTTWLYIIHAL